MLSRVFFSIARVLISSLLLFATALPRASLVWLEKLFQSWKDTRFNFVFKKSLTIGCKPLKDNASSPWRVRTCFFKLSCAATKASLLANWSAWFIFNFVASFSAESLAASLAAIRLWRTCSPVAALSVIRGKAPSVWWLKVSNWKAKSPFSASNLPTVEV